MPTSPYKMVLVSAGITFIFVLDRISKWLTIHTLPPEGVFAIPGVAGFVLERNFGISYSIPVHPAYLVAAIIVILVALTILLIRAYRNDELQSVTALALIITGASSNLLDRLQLGYVVDMIVLTGKPIFNLSDVMILVGAIWLIFLTMRHRKQA